MDYTNYAKRTYNPKKAVKSFADLDVYQKSLESSVFVGKIIIKTDKKNKSNVNKENALDVQEYIIKNMIVCALNIPHMIAESHSSRFGTSEQCLLILDKVMLHCNKMVVYLEQTRDICETGIEVEQFDEQIKKYFYIRRKVLNLQRVWRKYIKINKEEGK